MGGNLFLNQISCRLVEIGKQYFETVSQNVGISFSRREEEKSSVYTVILLKLK